MQHSTILVAPGTFLPTEEDEEEGVAPNKVSFLIARFADILYIDRDERGEKSKDH